MAAVGPYGIEQFDAPGIIGAYQAAQSNRIRQMLAQKQLELETQKTAAVTGTQKAIQAYYGGGNSAGSAPNAPGSASGPSALSTSQPATNAPVAAPAASQGPTSADREKLYATLMAINPEMAGNVIDAFSKMDKATLEQTNQRNMRLAQIAAGVLQYPPEQRKAAIMQSAPELQKLGLSPDQINGFDPSDANLRHFVAQASDIERLSAFVQPKLTPVTQGGSIISTDPTGKSTTIYETPTVSVGNNVFARPSGMSSMSKSMTATNPKTGERIQSLDGGQTWQPIGGQTQPASGGFQ